MYICIESIISSYFCCCSICRINQCRIFPTTTKKMSSWKFILFSKLNYYKTSFCFWLLQNHLWLLIEWKSFFKKSTKFPLLFLIWLSIIIQVFFLLVNWLKCHYRPCLLSFAWWLLIKCRGYRITNKQTHTKLTLHSFNTIYI